MKSVAGADGKDLLVSLLLELSEECCLEVQSHSGEGRYDKNTLSQVVDTVILEPCSFGIFRDEETLALLHGSGYRGDDPPHRQRRGGLSHHPTIKEATPDG